MIGVAIQRLVSSADYVARALSTRLDTQDERFDEQESAGER